MWNVRSIHFLMVKRTPTGKTVWMRWWVWISILAYGPYLTCWKLIQLDVRKVYVILKAIVIVRPATAYRSLKSNLSSYQIQKSAKRAQPSHSWTISGSLGAVWLPMWLVTLTNLRRTASFVRSIEKLHRLNDYCSCFYWKNHFNEPWWVFFGSI